jgi:O-antigen/teichoic acid export membrane protein
MSQNRPLKPGASLGLNFSWNLAGNVVYSLCQWGVLISAAKLLTTEAVGQLTLALAITAPVIIFTNLGLRPAQATDVRSEFDFADYFGLRVVGSAVALVVIAGICAATGFGGETAVVILLVGFGKAVEAQSQIIYGLCQLSERMDFVAKSLVLRGIASLAAMLAAFVWTGSLAAGVLAQAVAWSLIFAFYDLEVGRRLTSPAPPTASEPEGAGSVPARAALRPRWNPERLFRLARLVLPLGFVGLLGSLYMNLPRYFVAEHLGLEQLGFFGALMYILIAGNYVIQALGQAAVSRLARHYAGSDRSEFVRLLLRLAAVGIVLGGGGLIVALAAGREILSILYTPEYSEYSDVFVLIMWAALIRFTASMLQYGLTAARRFRIHLVNQIVVTTVAIVACFALIEPYGLVGAGYAVIVASSVYLLGVLTIDWALVRGMNRVPGA